MDISQMNTRERAVYLTKETGIMPALKLKTDEDVLPYIEALHKGGAKVIEITITTPRALQHFENITAEFGDEIFLAAGTVLDPESARLAILSGVRVIVSPNLKPEVIRVAKRYGVACYCGSYTATEVLTAIEAGADMVKIFPAALAGPKYMTNLKMVYPEVNLVPSGGINEQTAAEYIHCGACAVSGARNFFDREKVKEHGLGWATEQTQKYIQIVAEAKRTAPPLP